MIVAKKSTRVVQTKMTIRGGQRSIERTSVDDDDGALDVSELEAAFDDLSRAGDKIAAAVEKLVEQATDEKSEHSR